MEHNRPVLPQDRESLVLLHQHIAKLVVTPVFLNGQARMALAILEENEAGSYLRVIGFLLNPGDETVDKLGNPSYFTPPSPAGTSN